MGSPAAAASRKKPWVATCRSRGRFACFSADYGHWDGVLRDCVARVARTRDYTRGHLAKLLAGNCLRLYGPRLARALGVEAPAAAAREG